ncbi:LptF/LptG family permease [Desulfosoma caldarium]|uniref:LptF/LptG family permease n=1 Tax=Desulfosoma caldarium TaxID=610254 RepID=UPI001475202C|nr:LptF/LptG family permease [Desulfosoma caldarium]
MQNLWPSLTALNLSVWGAWRNMGWTLYRYLMLDQLIPASLCFLGLLMILVTGRLMQFLKYLTAASVSATDILIVMALALPKLALYALPMASLMGTVLAFVRLSADNEIIAMRSAGISFRQMAPAVLTLALALTAVSFYTSVRLLPTANRELKSALRSLSRAVIPALLQEGRFIDTLPNMVFFFQHVDTSASTVRGVLIHDARNPQTRVTITAREAVIRERSEGNNEVVLHMQDGMLSRMGRDLKTSQIITFQSYDLVLSLDALLGSGKEVSWKRGEMSLAELRTALAQTQDRRYALEWHKRLALPFACLVLGMAAAPFGVLFAQGRRMTGITLSIALFLAYYLLLSAGNALGEQRLVPAAFGIWMPNAVTASVATSLWVKAHRQ